MPDDGEEADLAADPVELERELAPRREPAFARIGEVDHRYALGHGACPPSVVIGAAVDDERLSRDEACIGAGEEGNGADEIGRLHVAGEHAAAERRLLDAGDEAGIGKDSVAQGEAGRDAVDENAMAAEL